MNFALYLPNFGDEVSALALAELAAEAEGAGWDGFFLWDHMLYSQSQKLNIVDPWIALTAIAMKTTRLRFGTTVTPVSRRRPWHLARETAATVRSSGAGAGLLQAVRRAGELLAAHGLGRRGDDRNELADDVRG